MDEVLKKAVYEGVTVDLLFDGEQPYFEDLFFMLRGDTDPDMPVDEHFNITELVDLGFDQVDDFWGIPTKDYDVGPDVIVWFYPLVDGSAVYHHDGPYTGFRLDYSILRSPTKNIPIFLQSVAAFVQVLNMRAIYRLRETDLGSPPNLTIVENDINEIVAYWREKGIEPGSLEAMRINC